MAEAECRGNSVVGWKSCGELPLEGEPYVPRKCKMDHKREVAVLLHLPEQKALVERHLIG